MRASFSSLMTAILLLSYGTCASAQTRALNTFSANLSLGSSGTQVVALQKILNRDPDTRITDAGPGSPGYETSHFGLLTKSAVVRFQEKYASEVLAPAGLTRGNGFVGFYTRVKLNALSALATNTGNTGPVVVPQTITSAPPASTTVSQNPNLQNLDLYIAAIDHAGLKGGLSSSTLSLIENKIRTEAATTTDFRQQFFDNQKTMYEKRLSEKVSQSPVAAFLETAFSLIAGAFSPEKAYAALGLPFGGYITYVNPIICDCPPGVFTHLFVALPNANPVISNLLLDYVNGSEAFLWHNIPEPGIATLGTYVPVVPSCWTYIGVACVLVPAEGQITPMVGSSLVP